MNFMNIVAFVTRQKCRVALFGLCVGIVFGGTGCQTLAPLSEEVEKTLTQAIDQTFLVEGRFSAQIKDEALTAVFSWAHEPSRDDISLATPLGAMMAKITRDKGAITFSRGASETQTWREAEGERAFYEALGFPLPLKALPYWLRGMPRMESAATEILRDDQGRVISLQEEDWRVTYAYVGAARLPDRLTARRDEVSLKVKIDQWEGFGKK